MDLKALSQQLRNQSPRTGGQMGREQLYGGGRGTPTLDQAAIGTSSIPILGDIAGFAADANMYANEPESRNWANYGMSAAGALPFVPAAAVVRGVGSKGEEIASQLRKYDDSLDASLTANPKGITLNKIEVDKARRGQGVGSEFMSDLTRIADDQGLQVQLSPTGEFGASPKRLREFYKRYGFVENKGRNKDFEINESMYRNPKE